MNGGNKCNYKRNNSIDSQGEIAILEASYGRGKKRGSIATHVLMKTRHKKGPLTDLKTNKAEVILGSPSPVEKSDNEIMSEEQRDRSMKMFQMLKKNEKPKLIGLVGKPKDSITKEDVAKESILSFRRRLKRKRVRFITVMFFYSKFNFVLKNLPKFKWNVYFMLVGVLKKARSFFPTIFT
jgi:hypothetical protein